MSLARPRGRPAHGHPGSEQAGFDLGELPAGPGPAGGGYGLTARATHAAAQAAADTGVLDAVDAAMAALAVELARAVDIAAAKGDARQIAAAGRELRETLTRLRLDPSARGGGSADPDSDALGRFLAGLSVPALGDTAHP